MDSETPRKSAQEVEIDRLLAEEFACDPGFAARFLSACGVADPDFAVAEVIAEPSLGGEGYGDLLVTGQSHGARAALLIENKISAAAGVRQAARYARHAARLVAAGHASVLTILVAPRRYVGERGKFMASVDLETVADLLHNADPRRLAFKRAILARAVAKQQKSGVAVPDAATLAFKRRHLEVLARLGAGLDLTLPALRPAYYDNDSWIDRIRSPGLPHDAVLRHRCWLGIARKPGCVDLILLRPDPEVGALLERHRPPDARVARFSKAKGWQVSLEVPEMRPDTPYSEGDAAQAVAAMGRLIDWFRALPITGPASP